MATTTASPSPSPSPAPEMASATARQLAAALGANKLRLVAITDRLTSYFNGDILLNTSDIFHLVFTLARAIDYALSRSDTPSLSYRLPSLIKQAYSRRNDPLLQSAIMALMISTKNACNNGWFSLAEAEDLLRMANELYSGFCTSLCAPDVGCLEVILKIMPRFYPQLEFCGLLISFEAKNGYDILVSDFQVGRDLVPEQKIRLLVIQKDKLETSSCLISPQQVNILINGRAVEKRTNISMDPGPQIPTLISRMLKFGTNIVQSIGYFDGNYIIAIAFVNDISPPDASRLEVYVRPEVPTSMPDSDIMEGPSRITLNCPLSFKRIKTPVKGKNCKHHQCFDYDNYMEINSRKPTWRCACCNSPTSFVDLRVDQNMIKILQETGEDVLDVVISADGSWKPVENNESMNQLNSEKSSGKQDNDLERERSASPNIVDLTMDELNDINTFEKTEQKPFKYQVKFPSQYFPEPSTSRVSMSSQSATHRTLENFSSSLLSRTCAYPLGGLESLVSNVLLNPVQTDAVSSANSRDPSPSVDLLNSVLSYQEIAQGRQHSENMQLDKGRPQIPRYVNRMPVAIQALPAPTQASGSSRRLQTDMLNPNAVPGHLNSSSYQTVSPGTSASSGFSPANNDMVTEQNSRSSNLTSSLMHQPSSSQSQLHREYQGYALNSSGPPVPNVMGSQAFQENLSGAGAYRVPPETLLDNRVPNQVLNPRRQPYRGSGIPHIPSFPAAHQQQAPMQQNNVETSRSNLLSGWSSAQAAMMRAGAARHLSANKVPSSTAVVGMNSTQPAARPEGSMEQPIEQNWQPTGRMRGSLTGSAYEAALNQYSIASSTQSRQPPPSNSSIIPQAQGLSVSAQDSAPFTASSISQHGPSTGRNTS